MLAGWLAGWAGGASKRVRLSSFHSIGAVWVCRQRAASPITLTLTSNSLTPSPSPSRTSPHRLDYPLDARSHTQPRSYSRNVFFLRPSYILWSKSGD